MNESTRCGQEAENKFISDAIGHGWVYLRHANRIEDIQMHWDLMFRKDGKRVTVDVKAHKHECRNGPLLENWFWIEWQNVHGNDGWIKGLSDYIAFEYFNEWYIYKTDHLKGMCELLVDFDKKATKASEADYAVYTRKGRKDQTSCVMICDLSNILEYKWESSMLS